MQLGIYSTAKWKVPIRVQRAVHATMGAEKNAAAQFGCCLTVASSLSPQLRGHHFYLNKDACIRHNMHPIIHQLQGLRAAHLVRKGDVSEPDQALVMIAAGQASAAAVNAASLACNDNCYTIQAHALARQTIITTTFKDALSLPDRCHNVDIVKGIKDKSFMVITKTPGSACTDANIHEGMLVTSLDDPRASYYIQNGFRLVTTSQLIGLAERRHPSALLVLKELLPDEYEELLLRQPDLSGHVQWLENAMNDDSQPAFCLPPTWSTAGSSRVIALPSLAALIPAALSLLPAEQRAHATINLDMELATHSPIYACYDVFNCPPSRHYQYASDERIELQADHGNLDACDVLPYGHDLQSQPFFNTWQDACPIERPDILAENLLHRNRRRLLDLVNCPTWPDMDNSGTVFEPYIEFSSGFVPFDTAGDTTASDKVPAAASGLPSSILCQPSLLPAAAAASSGSADASNEAMPSDPRLRLKRQRNDLLMAPPQPGGC